MKKLNNPNIYTKLIADKKQLNKAIKSISTRGNNLLNDINIAAISALHHAYAYGDNDKLTALYSAVTKHYQKNLALYFLDNHTGLYFEKGQFFISKGNTPNLERAKTMLENLPSFSDYRRENKPEKAPVDTLNINDKLSNLYKGLSTDAQDNDNLDTNELKQLNALESYTANIINGVALENAVNASGKTVESIEKDLRQSIYNEILEGKTAYSKKIIKAILSGATKKTTASKTPTKKTTATKVKPTTPSVVTLAA